MELRQMEYFLMVCEVSSFTRAAERLYVSQPAVTSAIKALEDELGIQLFDRAQRQATLTNEGQIFYKHIKHVMHGVTQTLSEIDNLKKLNSGSIHLGLTALASIAPLPQIIADFKVDYPDIQIYLSEGNSKSLQNQLVQEEIDLAVIFINSKHPNINYMPLQKDELVVCVKNTHHLARKKKLTLTDIVQEKLIILKQGCQYRQLLIENFEKSGTLPEIQFEIDQIETIKSLLIHSNAISILPKMLCTRDPELTVIPLSKPIEIQPYLAHKENRNLSHAAKAFINKTQNCLGGQHDA